MAKSAAKKTAEMAVAVAEAQAAETNKRKLIELDIDNLPSAADDLKDKTDEAFRNGDEAGYDAAKLAFYSAIQALAAKREGVSPTRIGVNYRPAYLAYVVKVEKNAKPKAVHRPRLILKDAEAPAPPQKGR